MWWMTATSLVPKSCCEIVTDLQNKSGIHGGAEGVRKRITVATLRAVPTQSLAIGKGTLKEEEGRAVNSVRQGLNLLLGVK